MEVYELISYTVLELIRALWLNDVMWPLYVINQLKKYSVNVVRVRLLHQSEYSSYVIKVPIKYIVAYKYEYYWQMLPQITTVFINY